MQVSVIGMVWYRQEEYDAAMAIMADRSKLHASFHVWRNDAEAGEKKFRREGKTVVRAFIDPKTFPDWCRARSLDIDAKARMEFANSVAYDYVRNSHGNPGGVH